MDTLLSVAIGVGLAAACGFRVFVPLLVLSLAARNGFVPLSENFNWVASTPALITFATATVLEVLAYYVPWLDNLLDVAATPTAVLAGIIASASVLVDLPPMLKWSVAIIGGGGAAGLVQGTTGLLRLKSTALTGGLANPLVATVELGGAVTTAILAIVAPMLGVIAAIVAVVLIVRWSSRRRALSNAAPSTLQR
jgi:hypothetical protein